MSLDVRFAIASDLHIAIPPTIRNLQNRFHLVEVSIPVLEQVLDHFAQLNLDFMLIPGDLTQDGEAANHQWLQNRLQSLPFPVYVVPGNHDVPSLYGDDRAIAFDQFTAYYQKFGYLNPEQLYYTCELLPGLQLMALNSNQFDRQGRQIGYMDEEQFLWLEGALEAAKNKFILVMIHHNIIEHLPGQSQHPLGRRYMLDNAPRLRQMLKKAGVKLLFTGHLHVQDIVWDEGLFEITTGSLVSYPHPYRILHLSTGRGGQKRLEIESFSIGNVPGWENLKEISREWIGERSRQFMLKLLTTPPLNLSVVEADKIIPDLRYFWADIAEGNKMFHFPQFPPQVQSYFESFSSLTPEGYPQAIDNYATLLL